MLLRLLCASLADLLTHATKIKLSFHGLHSALNNIAAERTISQQQILCSLITHWCSESVSEGQITDWLTHSSTSVMSQSEVKHHIRELKATEFLIRLGFPLIKGV